MAQRAGLRTALWGIAGERNGDMSVFVDELRNYGGSASFRWTNSCHMYADTLDELHAMADRIGMKRAWFQDKHGFPHYDLVERRRIVALRAGAVEADKYHMVNFSRAGRDLPPLPRPVAATSPTAQETK